MPKENARGRLFVIAGPSGVGKKTLSDILLQKKELNLVFSVSCTTRPRRLNETHGVEYFFISKEEFRNRVKQNEMLEYAEFFNNYYGTSREYVESRLNEGSNVLVEIETIGFHQLKERYSGFVSIFILPPDLQSLRDRLQARGTESEADIDMRIEKARLEIPESTLFDYRVVNENVEEAVKELEQIFVKEINKPRD